MRNPPFRRGQKIIMRGPAAAALFEHAVGYWPLSGISLPCPTQFPHAGICSTSTPVVRISSPFAGGERRLTLESQRGIGQHIQQLTGFDSPEHPRSDAPLPNSVAARIMNHLAVARCAGAG